MDCQEKFQVSMVVDGLRYDTERSVLLATAPWDGWNCKAQLFRSPNDRYFLVDMSDGDAKVDPLSIEEAMDLCVGTSEAAAWYVAFDDWEEAFPGWEFENA